MAIRLQRAAASKGPSDSVSNRSLGMFIASRRPLLPVSIAGLTLNQQPSSIARVSSFCVPENPKN